jgi:hypothetical protein
VSVFIGQGLANELVVPTATKDYVALLCSQGADVAFHTFHDITHALAADASLPELLPWLADVDAGRTPPSDC